MQFTSELCQIAYSIHFLRCQFPQRTWQNEFPGIQLIRIICGLLSINRQQSITADHVSIAHSSNKLTEASLPIREYLIFHTLQTLSW